MAAMILPYITALQDIDRDGYLYWQCHTCAATIRAHITDPSVNYLENTEDHSGSVIALPACMACGPRKNSQTSLKAHYTPEDVLHGDILYPFFDDEDNQLKGFVMKLHHARNFRLLHLLAPLGKLPDDFQPLLPVLPYETIEASPLAQYPVAAVDAFWLPMLATGLVPPLPGMEQPLLALRGAQQTPLLGQGGDKEGGPWA